MVYQMDRRLRRRRRCLRLPVARLEHRAWPKAPGGSRRHGRRLPAARPAAPGGTAGGSRRHGRRLPAAPGGTAGGSRRRAGASRQHGRALAEGWGSRVKPASFAYHRARSVPEAIALLAELGDEAKILAGGLSLVPMMNFRLARPTALVDVTRIPGLSY